VRLVEIAGEWTLPVHSAAAVTDAATAVAQHLENARADRRSDVAGVPAVPGDAPHDPDRAALPRTA
jgi:hypothetical protein